MNRRSAILKTLKTTILLLGGGLVALTCFTSCENFLKGADVKKQLDEQIAYANAPSCSVTFSAEGMGEFLGNKKETFKVGFASLVQFKVNAESYAFLGLEAVANNAEYTPLTDSVKFEEAEKDEKNGIYKYNVTILKDTKELLIRPTCLAFPEVVSYSPISGVEQYANTPIEITFSMPMEDPETTADQSLFKYPNVYLIYTDSVKNNHDMSAYFEEPVFDVEKKKLRLVPKSVQLSNFIGNTIPSIDIAISFASEIVVKKEGLTLPLKQNEKSNFKIRYKKDMEETPPEKKAFFATGDEIHLSDSPVFKNKKKT